MSQSTRFIALALVGWIGLRAVSLGLIPGGEAIAFDRNARGSAGVTASGPPLPAVIATEFAPIDPIAVAAVPTAYPPSAADAAYPIGHSQAYPLYYIPVAYAAGISRGSAVMRPAASLALPGPDQEQRQ